MVLCNHRVCPHYSSFPVDITCNSVWLFNSSLAISNVFRRHEDRNLFDSLRKNYNLSISLSNNTYCGSWLTNPFCNATLADTTAKLLSYTSTDRLNYWSHTTAAPSRFYLHTVLNHWNVVQKQKYFERSLYLHEMTASWAYSRSISRKKMYIYTSANISQNRRLALDRHQQKHSSTLDIPSAQTNRHRFASSNGSFFVVFTCFTCSLWSQNRSCFVHFHAPQISPASWWTGSLPDLSV